MADIICQNGCHGRFHETTEHYRADRPTNGSMLRLKEPYRSYGWSSFGEHDASRDGDLECPGCGAPYCIGGRVRVDVDPCRFCGRCGRIMNGTVCPECDAQPEAERLYQEYEPELPDNFSDNFPDISVDNLNDKIRVMHAAGKKPGEIAKELGLGHHMAVRNKLRAMGLV